MTGLCPEHKCELVWGEASSHGASLRDTHDVAFCETCFEEKGPDCKFWSTNEYYEDFEVDNAIKQAKENEF